MHENSELSRPEGLRAGVEFLGGGIEHSSHQLEGLRERCKLLQTQNLVLFSLKI